MWYGILYIIIGLFVSIWYFELKLGKKYRIAKNKGEINDAVVCIYILFLTILWPIIFFIIIYDKIKNVKRR